MNNRTFKDKERKEEDIWEDIVAFTGSWSTRSKLLSDYDATFTVLNISTFA